MKITTGRLNLRILAGNSNPEGQIIASRAEMYLQDDGAEGKIWKKKYGDGNATGWVQMAEVGGGGSSSVQVPISFTAVDGQQTYSLPQLIAGAVLDQVTADSSILSPILGDNGFIIQAVGNLTFKAPTFHGGEQVVILWHLP